MPIRFLPLATGLLPIIAIHASLLLAISFGTVPTCIPYIDGCTSISATGRYEPSVFLFKPAMVIEAALMTAYWYSNVGWLRSISGSTSDHRHFDRYIRLLGTGSAIALVIYVTFLGTQTPLYEFMRRFGVYLYFLFAVLAQILLAIISLRLARQRSLSKVLTVARIQLWLALIPFGLGALNLVLKATLDDSDAAENVIEWIFALLVHVYFTLSWISWRATSFRFKYATTMP